MTVHPADLARIRQAADAIREMMEGDDDLRAFTDTLEGETDAFAIMDRLLFLEGDTATMVSAIKDHESTLRQRRQRLEDRSVALRDAMQQVLDAAGLRTMPCPLGTVSLSAVKAGLVEIDAAETPTQLLRPGQPDKAAIKKSLEAGEPVPGWALGDARDTVTVRRK